MEAKQSHLLSGGSFREEAEEERQERGEPSLPSGHPLAANMQRLTLPRLSYLSCGHLAVPRSLGLQLFPSVDQIQGRDLSIVINIAHMAHSPFK
jgi:hypothetical protein